MSVHWPVIRKCISGPLRRVIVDDRGTMKRAEVLVGALHVAGEIESRCKSDTVGVLLPSGGAFPVSALAGWMLGKTVVPLNFLLKEDQLDYVVRDCGTDTIITSRQLLEHMGFTPRVKNLIVLEDVSFKGVPEPRWPKGAGDDDLAVLLYTSGTSGNPKGVMLTHGNLSANIAQAQDWIHFTSSERILGVLPQFHSFGLTVLTLLPLTVGCEIVYSARFIPHRIVKIFREQRPTAFVGIPSMYGALLTVKDAGPEDFTSLRLAVSGGEPLSEDVRDRFRERFGITINEGYGLTETSPVTNWCRPDEFRPGTVGMPLPRIEQRILDLDSRKPLPPESEGEIVIRGPNVMRGYYNLPDETRAAIDADGWFRTGDIGRMDKDGFLYITGRLKEMMIVGGENVFPREIEEVINKHPKVHASGVVGLNDPVRGEVPVAFVEMEEDETFDEDDLVRFCREHLPGYKAPRSIYRLDALPRNPTGKILRRELRVPEDADAAGS